MEASLGHILCIQYSCPTPTPNRFCSAGHWYICDVDLGMVASLRDRLFLELVFGCFMTKACGEWFSERKAVG